MTSEPLPLSEFPERERAEIERLASAPCPPPKWRLFGDVAGRPMIRIMSRAFYEWHIRHGRDPRLGRESIPKRVRALVLKRDRSICQLCGLRADAADVHIDHIVPVSRGGLTVLANLQVAHSMCNLKKGNRA